MKSPIAQVARFNRQFAVGDEVDYASGPLAQPERRRVAMPAQIIGGHTAVVWLHGKTGFVTLDEVRRPTVVHQSPDRPAPQVLEAAGQMRLL